MRFDRNGNWQTRTVAKILRAGVYAGDLVQGVSKVIDHKQVRASADEWTVVRDTHEAIVSRELFDAVQKALDHAAQQAKDREITFLVPQSSERENLLRPLWAQPSPAKNASAKRPRMYMSTTASATTASRKALALARLSLKKSCWMPWPI